MEETSETNIEMGFKKTIVICLGLLLVIFFASAFLLLVFPSLLFFPIAFNLILLILYLFLFGFSVTKLIFLNKKFNKIKFLNEHKGRYILLNVILFISILLPLVLPLSAILRLRFYKNEEANKKTENLRICEDLQGYFENPVVVNMINLEDATGNGIIFVGDRNIKIESLVDFKNVYNEDNLTILDTLKVIGKQVTIDIGPCSDFNTFLYIDGQATATDIIAVSKKAPYNMEYVIVPAKVFLDNHRIYTYTKKLIQQK